MTQDLLFVLKNAHVRYNPPSLEDGSGAAIYCPGVDDPQIVGILTFPGCSQGDVRIENCALTFDPTQTPGTMVIEPLTGAHREHGP